MSDLKSAAAQIAKTEAAIRGLIRFLKASRPDLAPDLEKLEMDYEVVKEAARRRKPRQLQRRGSWESRNGAWLLVREERTLAVVHRDSDGWHATFLPGLRAFTDAAGARKSVERHLNLRPHQPEEEMM